MISSHPLLYVMAIAVVSVALAKIPRRFRVEAAVLEILLGLIVGSQVLGLLTSQGLLEWLGNAGLAALFFMSGLELDLGGVRGRPIRLAAKGWILSVVLAVVAVALLFRLSLVSNPSLIVLALTTTALGTVFPALRNAGELKSKFGARVIAAGVIGEFGPTILMAFVLTQGVSEWRRGALLLAFVVVSCLAAFIALRARPPRLVRILSDTLHTNDQLPVRLSILFIAAFLVLSEELGLEAMLGPFAAGMVVGLACRGEKGEVLRQKLVTLCFGFFAPFFFVTTGMNLNIGSFRDSFSAFLLVPLFLVLFFVVRGAGVLFYRNDLDRRDRFALALYSATTLPMVLVLTHIGVRTERMLSSEAAALVAAAVLSVLLFPAIAEIVRSKGQTSDERRAA